MTGLKVLLLSHYATTAMQDFLTLYLNSKRVALLTVVNFPLPEIPRLSAIGISEFRKGKPYGNRSVPTFVRPAAIAYAVHFFQCLYLLGTVRRGYDVVISQNAMLGLAVLIGRRKGRVRKVVYYSHGLSSRRFGNALFNSMYRILDDFVYRRSDVNWALSADISKERKTREDKPIRVVPATVPTGMFPESRGTGKHPVIVFIGMLNTLNGADLLPEVLRNVRMGKHDVSMDIIGIGPEEQTIRSKIRAYGLDGHIRLFGYRELKDYASGLSGYFCGIAPYRYDASSLLTTTDPMKIQVYQAAGLPIITTKGYSFSERIERAGVGISVPCDSTKLARAVIKLLADRHMYSAMRKRSRTQAEADDIFAVYDRAFGDSI